MTDPVDSFAVEGLDEYEGLPLVSVTGSDLKLDEDKDAAKQTSQDELKDLRDYIRRTLQDHVSEVRISDRLTDSPVCLVVPEGGLAPHIERVLRATRKDAPRTKRILEVNPSHPLVKNLEKLFAREPGSAKLAEWIELLFEQALLAEGSPVEDPIRFATRLTALLQEASGAVVT
jgi:molecular chaperone HtpG